MPSTRSRTPSRIATTSESGIEVAALELQEFGVAAAGAAEDAALEPEREAAARPLGLGVRHDLRDAQVEIAHAAALEKTPDYKPRSGGRVNDFPAAIVTVPGSPSAPSMRISRSQNRPIVRAFVIR